MKPIKFWYLFVGFVLVTQLLSCGTNRTQKISHYSENDESGIGGTGILANQSGIGGTGIIGEITGFGSIFVNGVEVELDSNTPLYVDGKKVSEHIFSRGEVVALRAEQNGKLMVAREIFIRHEVVGRVEKVMPQLQRVLVLGQIIDTRALSNPPKKGAFVRVSGFRDTNNIIHARYVGKANNDQQNLLLGKIQRKGNKWFVGQQQVNLANRKGINVGDVIRVKGQVIGSVLQVNIIQKLKRLPFTAPVRNLLIQGHVFKNNAQQLIVSGYQFNMKSLSGHNLQKMNKTIFLQREKSRNTWEFSRIINRQTLPKGSTSRIETYHRPQQPVRLMTPRVPHTIPYRFFR